MSFTRNDDNVKKESFGGGRISETGKYIGRFTQAYELISEKTGSKALHLDFISDSGESCSIDIWHWSAKSQSSMSFSLEFIDSLMACMGLTEIPEKVGQYEKYNFDLQANETVRGTVYPALLGGKIGVVFQMQEYEKKDGSVGQNAVAVKFFNAKTGQSGKETLLGEDAIQIDEYMAKLPQLKRLKHTTKEVKQLAESSGLAPVAPLVGELDDTDYPF